MRESELIERLDELGKATRRCDQIKWIIDGELCINYAETGITFATFDMTTHAFEFGYFYMQPEQVFSIKVVKHKNDV